MRFSLVDRITELEPGESITAVKNLSRAEEYLQDHFPGFPVMPGVLMLESLVQTSAWLFRITDDFEYSTILLRQAKAVRFNSFLTPGQTLTVTSSIHKRDGDECTFKTAGHVDGKSTVSARVTLTRFNLTDQDPNGAQKDASRIAELRQEFGQVWQPPE